MSNTTQTVSHTLPVANILGVAFIVLKLCNVISWSWWWVTAPFWGPVVVFLGIAGAIASVWALAGAVTLLALVFRKRK